MATICRTDVSKLNQWKDRKSVPLKLVKYQSEGFTHRIEAAMDTKSVQFLHEPTIQLQDLEARSYVPDVNEGDVGELTAPLRGQADSAARRHDDVTDRFPQRETFVGELPHAVQTSDSLGLSQNILKCYLQQIKTPSKIPKNLL